MKYFLQYLYGYKIIFTKIFIVVQKIDRKIKLFWYLATGKILLFKISTSYYIIILIEISKINMLLHVINLHRISKICGTHFQPFELKILLASLNGVNSNNLTCTCEIILCLVKSMWQQYLYFYKFISSQLIETSFLSFLPDIFKLYLNIIN